MNNRDAVVTAEPLKTETASDTDAVQALKDALTAAGIDPSSLNLTAKDELVTDPSGNFQVRYISVTTSKGTMGLGTDLVAQSPTTAVLDIKHMLGIA